MVTTKCECLDCIKSEKFATYFNNRSDIISDHLENTDNLSGVASDFINAKLVALKPVTVYSSADTLNPIKTLRSGETVGVIYSYVTRPDGLWWNLDNDRFVKHGGGLFDEKIIEKSLADYKAEQQALIDARVKKRLEENTNPFYNFADSLLSLGDTLKWSVIAVVIILVAATVYKITK